MMSRLLEINTPLGATYLMQARNIRGWTIMAFIRLLMAVAEKKLTELPRSLIKGRIVIPKEGPISRWHMMLSNKYRAPTWLLSGLCLAPMAIGADLAIISHCTVQEKIFFSCQVGKKVVSICALENSGEIDKLIYRYGFLGKIENEYVASVHNQHRFFGTAEPVAPRASVDQTWFVSGDVKYLLTACRGGDCDHTAGLTVFRRERILSNTRCAETKDSQPWFAREVVYFGGDLDSSKSNTKLLILMEDDNSLEKIYPSRMQDSQ
jgi:hypothetical protein